MKDQNDIMETMGRNQMNEELEKIDRSVNRMFLVLVLAAFSILTMFVVYYMQTTKTIEVKKELTSVSDKVDTAINVVENINQNLTTINQKLDESIQSNEHLINGIGDVSNDVNKVNRSVQKVGKSVDTLIIYIKK
jgi:uncharacterized protein YoxC